MRARARPRRPTRAEEIEATIALILFFFVLAVVALVGLTSCFGYCPAHASLCDPRDFDPKCVIDDCRGARDDAGIR